MAVENDTAIAIFRCRFRERNECNVGAVRQFRENSVDPRKVVSRRDIDDLRAWRELFQKRFGLNPVRVRTNAIRCQPGKGRVLYPVDNG